MKLEQSFEVTAPVDQVWAALIDVPRAAPCLPGADVSGRNEDGSYNGSFRVKLGPTAAVYAGTLVLETVDESAHTATMHASGTDRRGKGGARATIVSTVKEGAAGSTVVEVASDYTITGRLARFGRGGMIDEIGARLLTEFAAALQSMLTGPGDYETFVGMPAVSAAEGAGAEKAQSEAEKSRRKPRKDLAAAADAVAAASQPAAPEPVAAAEPEPVAAEPEPEPVDAEELPDLAVEAAAEEELAAVMPEASAESEPPTAEVPPPPAEPELEPPAPELEPPAPASVPEPEPAPAEPAPEPVPVPPVPEPLPEPEPEPEPAPAPEPPTPEPPAPPPPPAVEAEPLDGLALARAVIVERIKSNPVAVVALLLGLLLLRRRRRRGR